MDALLSERTIFYPEEKPLTWKFRNLHQSLVGIWVVAEIEWDTKGIISQNSWFCPVRVNGNNVDKAILKSGKIQIRKSLYILYDKNGN